MTPPPKLGRLFSLFATCLACAAPAFASPEPSSGEVSRCNYLYGLWRDYEQDPVFSHSGERAQAELALYRCLLGDYRDNVAILEGLLKHGRFSTPESIGTELVKPANVGQRPE